ncbi:MAG: hypothetical protein RMJ66_05450 [Bacteroidia bacterium]|nr:carboxypeptidase-like regulatory domain-containing protein [Bacteroidia bacterium]MDW8134494.1 hypothetical protein [Bacteroidia bacterium]
MYRLLIVLSLLWAQEEGRAREGATASRKTKGVSEARSEPEVVLSMETLSGRVVDRGGKGLSNIRLWIVDKQTGKVLGETKTGEGGNFALAVPVVEKVIVRMSREGKEFVEREATLEELVSTDPEFIFDTTQ